MKVFLKALSPEDGSTLDTEGQILISQISHSKIKRTKSNYSQYAEKSFLLKSIL